MAKKKKPLFESGADWTFELLNKTWIEIEHIAKRDLKITWYTPQIEVISSEQMIDAYASTGLPIMYKHWSFGKEFLRNNKAYKDGQMGLAYEIVINSSPCIAYLMEENNMLTQTLVMAHASVGHSAVFKNNMMFKQFTDASAIVDYLLFAKNYIAQCEEKYGLDEVESFLDSCHALMNYGVDRYKVKRHISDKDEEHRAMERLEHDEKNFDPIWNKTVPKKAEKLDEDDKWPKEREDNLLYFIEKYAPDLPSWKRELIRIVRKISQYFYPQATTKVLNEGYATFTHYYIMAKLYEEGLVTEGSMLEFYKLHSGVTYQPEFDKKWFSGMNPYALGFAIFMDIKRICEEPTEEDKRWFPQLIGMNWVDAVNDAMMNYKDDTFIAQFLSPKVIRDFKLFKVTDDTSENFVEISAIHDDAGYQEIRTALSNSYNRANWVPDIQVEEVDALGDRTLYLVHEPYLGRQLDPELAEETLAHVANLWEFDVFLESPDESGMKTVDFYAIGTKNPNA
jgi:spore cortex formation protein SpoVR/YcgB (stage V sporulation)